MDTFLLSLLLGYKALPDRAGVLWDYMDLMRGEIAFEETHKNREPVLAHKYGVLETYELEFRRLLIAARKEEGKNREG